MSEVNVLSQFKVYPVGNTKRTIGRHFVVVIANSRRDVNRLYTEAARTRQGKSAMAFLSVSARPRGKTLGHIVFDRHVDTDTLVHESCHAAIAFCCYEKKGTIETNSAVHIDNERICTIAGNIASDIATALYEHNVWKPHCR
jgi:hypothetical protein